MIWLAVVALVIAGFYVPRLGKVLLALIGVCVLAGLGLLLYFNNQQQRQRTTPVRQTTLDGIGLGEHEDDVLLSKGRPSHRFEDDPSTGFGLMYGGSSKYSPVSVVSFGPDAKVRRVCKYPGSNEATDFGVRPDDAMRDYHAGADAKVLERLGLNFTRSISEDRLEESRTWLDYKLSFDVAAGKITAVCLTNTPVRFVKERRFEEPLTGVPGAPQG